MSMLEMKGEEYMEEKIKRMTSEYAKGARGWRRKSMDEGDKREDGGINQNVTEYLKHRETIEGVRKSDPNDSLVWKAYKKKEGVRKSDPNDSVGWNAYIKKKVAESRLTKGTKQRGLLLKNGHGSLEILMVVSEV
jgi:hypothetical protein